MFVKSAEGQKKPVKIWLNSIEQVGSGCLEKVANLSNLPFVYKWPTLMPNCHEGYGMPIGGVIATESVIIPNAVGEDIGCGMSFVQTDIHANLLKIEIGQTLLIQDIIDCIMRNVPVGLAQHQEKQACRTLGKTNEYLSTEHRVAELEQELRVGYYRSGRWAAAVTSSRSRRMNPVMWGSCFIPAVETLARKSASTSTK